MCTNSQENVEEDSPLSRNLQIIMLLSKCRFKLYYFVTCIVCSQRCQLLEDAALIDGYTSYFSFSRKRSGYSGVATYCRNTCTPKTAEEGLAGIYSSDGKCSIVNENCNFSHIVSTSDLQALDSEGRAVITHHEIRHQNELERLVIINVYCPRVDHEKPERKIYKIQFCQLLEAKANALRQEGCHVVVLGDMNISHHTIDHCDPGDEREFDASEARQWMTSFLSNKDLCHDEFSFVDSFRYFHPETREAYTCWNTLTGARQTNYGTRIDYILVSCTLLPMLTSCKILPNVHGSDHCPVSATFQLDTIPSAQLPAMCTRSWPEFTGKQQKLMTFLHKSQTKSIIANDKCATLKNKFPEKFDRPLKRTKIAAKTDKQKSITNFFKIGATGSTSNAGNLNPKMSTLTQNFNRQDLESTKMEKKAFSSEICKNQQENITEMFLSAENSTSIKDNSVADNTLVENVSLKEKQTAMWKSVLSGPPQAPLCKGHGKMCVLRTVKKEGPNYGRQFFTCPQPNGHASNLEARCNFFQWVTPAKRNVLKNS